MSEISVPLVTLRASPWRRRLRRAALALAAAAVALVAATRLSESAPFVWGAAAVALVLGAAWPVRDSAAGSRWRIGADGRVAVLADGTEVDAAVEFASSHLIVLRYGGRRLAVWRDAAPPVAFRRLSAAVRWRIERPQRPAAEETAA